MQAKPGRRDPSHSSYVGMIRFKFTGSASHLSDQASALSHPGVAGFYVTPSSLDPSASGVNADYRVSHAHAIKAPISTSWCNM